VNHGLFKVTERIYQIRGHDISNMTIVEGDGGLSAGRQPLSRRALFQSGYLEDLETFNAREFAQALPG